MLALNTGIRQNEPLALKWDNVDLERGVLRTLAHADKAFVLGEPKTKNSRHTIRLTLRAVDALREQLSRQLEEIGSLYQPGGLTLLQAAPEARRAATDSVSRLAPRCCLGGT